MIDILDSRQLELFRSPMLVESLYKPNFPDKISPLFSDPEMGLLIGGSIFSSLYSLGKKLIKPIYNIAKSTGLLKLGMESIGKHLTEKATQKHPALGQITNIAHQELTKKLGVGIKVPTFFGIPDKDPLGRPKHVKQKTSKKAANNNNTNTKRGMIKIKKTTMKPIARPIKFV